MYVQKINCKASIDHDEFGFGTKLNKTIMSKK